jgi:hypothetical protein
MDCVAPTQISGPLPLNLDGAIARSNSLLQDKGEEGDSEDQLSHTPGQPPFSDGRTAGVVYLQLQKWIRVVKLGR